MDRTKLRRALAAHFNEQITPEVAADIERAACAVTSLHDLWPMPKAAADAPLDPPPPWPASTGDAMLELLGDPDAVRMMNDIAAVSHAYDDLIDRDKPMGDDRIHALTWKLLVSLPSNPFYATHEALLRPVLIAGILNWHAANAMEASGDLEELRIAHAIRYSIGDVALVAMSITRGPAFAARNARRMRLLGQYDTWAHYKSEHTT